MKAITKPTLHAVIEIRVLKQTSAIYFFKGAIPDLGRVSWAFRLLLISYFWRGIQNCLRSFLIC
jgi:hypothetical protein